MHCSILLQNNTLHILSIQCALWQTPPLKSDCLPLSKSTAYIFHIFMINKGKSYKQQQAKKKTLNIFQPLCYLL